MAINATQRVMRLLFEAGEKTADPEIKLAAGKQIMALLAQRDKNQGVTKTSKRTKRISRMLGDG